MPSPADPAQLALPLKLPLDPWALAEFDLEPRQRGLLYNDLGLCSFQRAAIEAALRMVAAGIYPEAGR